jgi:hypothetical protein
VESSHTRPSVRSSRNLRGNGHIENVMLSGFPHLPSSLPRFCRNTEPGMDCDSEAADIELIHMEEKMSCSLQCTPFKNLNILVRINMTLGYPYLHF